MAGKCSKSLSSFIRGKTYCASTTREGCPEGARRSSVLLAMWFLVSSLVYNAYGQEAISNKAWLQPTFASSFSEESQTSMAVDGGKTLEDGPFFTDSLDTSNWLSIDLGLPFAIHAITLYARKDCCPEQLMFAEVRVGNNSVVTLFDDLNANPLVWKRQNSSAAVKNSAIGAIFTIALKPPVFGRWVTLQNKAPKNWPSSSTTPPALGVLEVEVWAELLMTTPGGGGGGGLSIGKKVSIIVPATIVLLLFIGGVVTAVMVTWRRYKMLQTGQAYIVHRDNMEIWVPASPPQPSAPAVVAAPSNTQQPLVTPMVGLPVYGTPPPVYYTSPPLPPPPMAFANEGPAAAGQSVVAGRGQESLENPRQDSNK